MDKIRISEIAKELSKTSKEVLQKAQELGFESKTASSSVTTEQADILYNYILSGVNPVAQSQAKDSKESKKTAKTKKSTEETKSKTQKNQKLRQPKQQAKPLKRKKIPKQTHQKLKKIPLKH